MPVAAFGLRCCTKDTSIVGCSRVVVTTTVWLSKILNGNLPSDEASSVGTSSWTGFWETAGVRHLAEAPAVWKSPGASFCSDDQDAQYSGGWFVLTEPCGLSWLLIVIASPHGSVPSLRSNLLSTERYVVLFLGGVCSGTWSHICKFIGRIT